MTNQISSLLPVSLSRMADVCGAVSILGDAESMINGFCSMTNLKNGSMTFVSQKSFLKSVDSNMGAFYIVKPEWSDEITNGLVHDNPMQAFRMLLDVFCVEQGSFAIASSAKISPDAKIGDNVSIGEFSIIEQGVVIGDNCEIGNHSTIGKFTILGERTKIGNRVSILERCQLGHYCVISDGVVIGGQGFGFSFEGGEWKPMPQIGRVIIGNEVHVGNNTCIDRGAIDDTVIGNNVIIDNLVHMAHNVQIGSHTALAGAVGMAGSAVIGKYCMFGGQVGIAGHIEICDGVQVNGGSKVLKSIDKPGRYAGALNVMPSTKWNRTLIYFQKLENLFKREKKRE